MTDDMTSPITEDKTVYLQDKSLWLQEGFLSEIEARLAFENLTIYYKYPKISRWINKQQI